MLKHNLHLAITVLVLALCGSGAAGQAFRYGAAEFNASRMVAIPAGHAFSVVVADFFHHGQIAADGQNVVVLTRNRQRVPARLLQFGPGDFCRLAFETVRGQSEYEILYGGDAPAETPPPWTSRDGLLLETRAAGPCDFRKLDAVRGAFAKAQPLGSDYVEQVYHGANPTVLGHAPFFSHYSGYLHIAAAGTYTFWTSSQDCSFLLIGQKLVVAAPGYHGPLHQARPGAGRETSLAAGVHQFDYYHATSGQSAMMAAYWEAPGGQGRPEIVPATAFRAQFVGHLPAGRVTLRTMRPTPDFVVRVAGEVPLPDNPTPLVAVLFRDTSPQPLAEETKVRWDFGDGQTSDFHDADHVYLHPGLYTVRFAVRHAGRTLEMTNRLAVDSPLLKYTDKQHTLDQYLAIMDGYDPGKLDAVALRQLVLAYEAKALARSAQTEDEQRRAEINETRMSDEARTASRARRLLARSTDVTRHLTRALATAIQGLAAEPSALSGDDDLLRLARIVGPMARDALGDSAQAFQVWRGVLRLVHGAASKAECEIEMADIAVNDLLNGAVAKTAVDRAAKHLGAGAGLLAARLAQVRGDCAAAGGDGKAAVAAYREAQRLLGRKGEYARQTARRGAHGRSVEEFLKQRQFDRAAIEIRVWQQAFPADAIDGYLSLMTARYWAGRKQYAQAIAQSERLRAVNRDSPYIDQLLYQAADCQLRQGHRDRSLATLRALEKDYPGSPFMPLVKRAIVKLESQ
jgi:TolA-binding protein